MKLDWVEALRPRRLGTIGVALEHDQADAEILNRALGLAQTQNGQSELVLLHVVDTPITRVLGPETADRESEADERYLADLVAALKDRGYKARVGLAARPQSRRRARQLPPARPGRPAGRRLARARPGPRPAAGSDRRQGPAQPGRSDADRPPRPRGRAGRRDEMSPARRDVHRSRAISHAGPVISTVSADRLTLESGVVL